MTSHAVSGRAPGPRQLWTPSGLWQFAAEYFLLLPLGALLALVWANTWSESYFRVAYTLSFAVNQIGMALFLALMTQEVFEATMPGGALHTWRRWAMPLVAGAGATLASAFAYLAYVGLAYEELLMPGWPIAGVIDIAFGYFIIKTIFGRHPALSFFLLLALTAGAIGIAAIAMRPDAVDIRPGGTGLLIVAIGLAALFRRFGVRQFWPYFVFCGTLSWWALFYDGIHPALALVPIVPLLPHTPRSGDVLADAPGALAESPRQAEHIWHHVVQVILFLFGLVNAGVQPLGYETGTFAVLVASLVAKPLGVLAAVALATLVGFHLPARLRWRELTVVALAASSGFTFALFVATGIYPRGPVLAQFKIGALLTGFGVVLAIAVARMLRVGRYAAGGSGAAAP